MKVIIMPRGPSLKAKPFQKLLTIMISGKPVTVEEIETLLGKEIMMYRLSTYMWHIKTQANGIVRVAKNGRSVVSYQLININQVRDYMRRVGVLTTEQIRQLSDLNASQIETFSENEVGV
jgi:hypothetical protein